MFTGRVVAGIPQKSVYGAILLDYGHAQLGAVTQVIAAHAPRSRHSSYEDVTY